MLDPEDLEFQLIIKILRAQASYNDLGKIDWESFKETLRRHKILSQTIRQMQTIPGFEVPEKIMASVKKQSALNMILSLESDRLIAILDSHSIKARPIKGAFLSEVIYQNKTSRDSGDIDLLIEEYQVNSAIAELKQLGYQLSFPLNPLQLYFEKKIGHALELMNPESGISLDLHWKIAESYFLPGSFSQYYRENLAQSDANPAILLSIAVQAYKEGWQKLGTLYDFYNFIAKFPQCDCAAVTAAAKFNITPAYNLTKRIAKDIFENQADLPKYSNELLNLLSGQSSFRLKIRSLFIRYVLPFGSDWQYFNLPPLLFPLYFPLKPIKSGFNFIRQYFFRD